MTRDIACQHFERLIDLNDHELRHPGEVYDRLRDEAPVVWVERLESYVITTYDAAVAVLADHHRFRNGIGHPTGPLYHDRDNEVIERVLQESPDLAEALATERGTWTQNKSLLDADPPLHTHQRQLVNRIFSPKVIRELQGAIEEIANDLIDRFSAAREVELVKAYAQPLPLLIIARQMGVDIRRLEDFTRWSNDFVAVIGNDKLTDEQFRSIARTRLEFFDYFVQQIDERRAQPRDDLLTAVAVSNDIDGNLISYADALRYLQQFISAGHETTANMLAHGILIVTKQPDLAERLRADSAAYEGFTEEVLRLSSPVQGLYRTCTEDAIVSGVRIPAGSFVLVLYAAANGDPRIFECPERLDVDRANSKTHLAFSKGIHHCIGAPLARAEGRIGFRALLERFYPWELAEQQVRWRKSFILNGPEAIHVVRRSAVVSGEEG